MDERKAYLKKIEKLIETLLLTLDSDAVKRRVKQYIKEEYNKGLDAAEQNFNVNFVSDKEDLKFLMDYADTKIVEVTDDISKDMKDIVNRGLIEDLNVDDVKQKIKREFNDKKYVDRFKMIVRTEGMRAGNKAQLDSAKQLSFKVKKYLDVTIDSRTSDICREEFLKYGSPKQAIDLDETFVVEVGNKIYEASAPPFHPNCRTVLMFTEEGVE